MWSRDERLKCYPLGAVYLNYDYLCNCKRLRHSYSSEQDKFSGEFGNVEFQ